MTDMTDAIDRDPLSAARARMAQAKARLTEEHTRVNAVKASGAWPKMCGTEGVDAPARGPLRVARGAGFEGRDVAKVCDVFDIIAARANREVFTAEQVATARRYAGLIEIHSKGAVKCSSMEAQGSTSGGTGADFMDIYLQRGREIDRMRQAVGSAVLEVGPRSTGNAIKVMDLVDRVCVSQMGLKRTLTSFGWSASGHNTVRLSAALSEAFDRMAGKTEDSRIRSQRSDDVDRSAQDIWHRTG